MNNTISIAARHDSNGAGVRKVLPVLCDGTGRLRVGSAALATRTSFIASAGAYTAGDAVGALAGLDLSLFAEHGAAVAGTDGSVVLDSICLVEEVGQAADLTLLFFNADPTAVASPTVVTDNAAFAWGAGLGFMSCVGKVDIAAADYRTLDTRGVVTLGGLGIVMAPSVADGYLYVALVTRGTPTYGALKTVEVKLGFRKL